MRKGKAIRGIGIILVITIILHSFYTPLVQFKILSCNENELVTTCKLSDDSNVTLTWTSRNQLDPQPLENGSAITGNHIVLNATFSNNLSLGNITKCKMHIMDGFLFESTQPLVNFTELHGDGRFDPAGLSWVIIQGFEIGY